MAEFDVLTTNARRLACRCMPIPAAVVRGPCASTNPAVTARRKLSAWFYILLEHAGLPERHNLRR